MPMFKDSTVVYETTCRICGGEFTYLGTHVVQAHGISAYGYRSEFGLSYAHRLISRDLAVRFRQIHSRRLEGQRDEMGDTARDDFRAFLAAANRRRRGATHCSHGHPYDDSNTRWDGTRRSCRACDARRQREYQHRKRLVGT